MIVTDRGKLYAHNEGLARALDVYLQEGWVSGFNDIQNGDTGTLLGEVSAPQAAVALSLHRNGAIVCIHRKGAEAAGFNGVWNCGYTTCTIDGNKLTWANDAGPVVPVSEVRIDNKAGSISATLNGSSHSAELEDDKLYWSDGHTWKRHHGSIKAHSGTAHADAAGDCKPVIDHTDLLSRITCNLQEESLPVLPAVFPCVSGSRREQALPDFPTAICTLSQASETQASASPRHPSVLKILEASARPAVNPNLVQTANVADATPTETPKDALVIPEDTLSSQRALFAATALLRRDGSSGVDTLLGGSGKTTRRDHTMCCC